MTRGAMFFVSIMLGLLAWLVISVYINYETYQKEVNLGYTGEAKSNDFYAAELFLAKYGMQIKSLTSILTLNVMPDTNDVLFIPTKRYDLGDDRVTELINWVKKGGHLIVLARYDYAKEKDDDDKHEIDDILFNRLGVRTHAKGIKSFFERFGLESDDFDELNVEADKDKAKNKSPDKKLSDSDNKKQAEKDTSDESKDVEDHRSKREKYESAHTPIDIKVNDKIENKKVYFIQDRWMTNEGDEDVSWSVEGENGAQLLEFKMDKGWVTLLSDINFLTNRHIDKFDHAAFLHTVVHIDDSKRQLWLIRNDDSPSIFWLIYGNAFSALMMFLIFVFVWLWYASRRFGPMAPNAQPIRRSMSEHITSAGHFQWRNHNRSELLASAQKALHEQIAQLRPLWLKLSEDELAEKLTKISGLDKEHVFRAITTRQVKKELEFTAIIEVLSTIRKKL